MNANVPSPTHSRWRDPVMLLWWALLVLTNVAGWKMAPGVIREAREGNGESAADIASINASIHWTHLHFATFNYIQFGISFILQVVAGVIAWLLLRSPDRNRFSVLVAFVTVALMSATYPPDIPSLLPGERFWQAVVLINTVIAIIGFFFLPLLFPSGHLAGKWVLPTFVLLIVVDVISSPIQGDEINSTIGEIYNVLIALILLGTIGASLVVNYRKATTIRERHQFKWVGFGMIMGLILFFTGDFLMRHIGPDLFGIVALFIFTVIMPLAFFLPILCIGIAILRYQLFDIDLLLSQTLIWIALTICVTGTYIGVVIGVGSLIEADSNLILSLVATGLVAVAFQPVSQFLRRRITRFIYGKRDDPYAALAKLGHRIESALTIDDLLPAIVRTAVEALSLPYAALYLDTPAGPMLTASAGSPTPLALNLPLTHGGQRIGTLAVGERSPGYTFSTADQALLGDLARQIGIAAQTVNLTADLQQSRERIIVAREEERRRLRRDLHDGLGSQLAALLIQTGSVRTSIQSDPVEAERELDILRTELRQAIADIRRLVAGLRPPALDELGLIAAMQERIGRFQSGGLDAGEGGIQMVQLVVPDVLPPLGAATEVALFRITEEAMTNIVKHAHATSAIVTLTSSNSTIHLCISDNGRGIDGSVSGGIGLTSMRERAEELGGRLTISPGPDGSGTSVLASIPIHRGVSA